MARRTIKELPIGCYIAGHWGQYGTARMIEFATELGYQNMDATSIAAKHLNHEPITTEQYELLTEYAFKAEDWLNENITPDQPEPTDFGWLDGEFYLLTKRDWNGEI